MTPRRVVCDERVEANRNRVALARGPIIYCFEESDNGEGVLDLRLADSAPLLATHRADLLGGLTVIETGGATAIPYYAWSQRAAGRMAVWVGRKAD
jgi:DUF1680 family protein